MALSSLVRRWISRSWCYESAQTHRFRSNSTSAEQVPPPARTGLLPSRVSPWLMLPPAVEGGELVYNLYNPAKDEIEIFPNLSKSKSGGELPPDDSKFVGSSHGWIASYVEEQENRIFLWNPISGKQIKLPQVEIWLRGEYCRGVSRLILSHSPEEADCRALICCGEKDRLAFCAPHSPEWTQIGDLTCEGARYEDLISDRRYNERNYEDFVYSRRRGLFFCITERNTEVEAWDLRDPLSPRIHWKLPRCEDLMFAHDNYPWPARTKKEWVHINKCFHPKYLVCPDHSDDLYVVVRHVVPRLRPDGSAAKRIYFVGYAGPWDTRYPYKTIEFDVFKVDQESGKLTHMEGSLEGLAIFVGTNHSFAVLASEYPELKPDSIYFTDEDRRITPKWVARTNFGGHDNGIYDYRDKTISSCCSFYPVEYNKIRRIVPPPMWFTPSHPSM